MARKIKIPKIGTQPFTAEELHNDNDGKVVKKVSALRRQQLRRIHDIIARAEKKGYYFGKFKEEYKSYSTQKLKSLTAPQVKSEAEYIPNFTDIILKNVEEMIEEAKNESWDQTKRNGFIVDGYLKSEISTYGRDKVAISCEQAPDDVITSARLALHASTDDACHSLSTEMVMIIRSHIPTIQEAKEYAEDNEDFMPLSDEMDEDFPF